MPFIEHEPFKPEEMCHHPDHHPPTMMLLPPGRHVWQCPACGKKTELIVPAVTC